MDKLTAHMITEKLLSMKEEDFKQFVFRVALAQPDVFLELTYSGPVSAAAMSQIRGFIEAGKKIPAIKLYREQTGLGLKEAKDAVDTLARHMGY